MRIVLLDNITAPSMKSRMSAPMRHGVASLDKYLVGLDLVKQLAEYTERKQPQHPDLTNERLCVSPCLQIWQRGIPHRQSAEFGSPDY